MGTKDLYNQGVPSQLVSEESLDSLGNDAESAGNIIANVEEERVYIPPVDFSSASNFAVYGSAEKYYEDSIKRIYTQFPYDGSQKEITEYTLSSSFLDRYILEKEYPRTNGFIKLSADGWGTLVNTASGSIGSYGAPATASYEYISFTGGPHSAVAAGDPLANAFSGSHNQNNIYDTSKNRGSNLRLNPASGSTAEFWLKKAAFSTSLTEKEVIFDVWNNAVSSSADYGRFRIELSGTNIDESPFRVTFMSGTSGFVNRLIGSSLSTSSVADDTWDHYAFTFVSSSTNLTARLYINGDLNDTQTTSSTINEVTGALVATIGSLRSSPSGAAPGGIGYGKLSASLDEFRYWKKERTPTEIGRNWFTQVRGGTNTDDANTILGVYYKFNEGTTATGSVDATVLDYSGRMTNGTWTGYGTNSRATGSAMVLSKAATSEFKDPIIYGEHPDVKLALTRLKATGSVHDYNNNASLYGSLPAWISETDYSGDLSNLIQVVASYFDTLQNQIRVLPKITNTSYVSSSYKTAPFADRLVETQGMVSPTVFIDADVMQQISSRDEDREYGLDLSEIKNLIYKNIYNNLSYINKSKGTEKSFRNLIRCYGVDEELIRLNTYGNNITYKLRDNYNSRAVATNMVNFNDPDRFNATVYQYTASSNANSVSYISGTAEHSDANDTGEDYLGLTLESEIIFPFKLPNCTTGSFDTGFTVSSLFGMHSADTSDTDDTSWPTSDYADIRVTAIRPNVGDNDVRFQLESDTSGIPTLTSDLFKDVYDNTKWSFAVRVVNEKYPLGDQVVGVSLSGSTATPFRVEFYGVNSELDIIRNEFILSGTMTNAVGRNLLRSAKRVYAGAHLTNFTGSSVAATDIKLVSVKYWSDYLSNDAIKAHARDTENYGTLNPYRNAFLTQTDLTGTYIPEIETLALHWNFANITSSNASGQFTVQDYSSGSVDLQSRYGFLGNIVKAQHTGRGSGFPASSKKCLDRDYIYAARQANPEIVQTSDMVNIMSEDDINFTRDQRPINYYFSIEKSMYQVISDEMP